MEPLKPLLQSYSTVCDRIQPGDVIIFSGVDLPSTVIKVATHSGYVHAAIIFSTGPDAWVHLDDRPKLESRTDTLLIAEAHIDTRLPSVGNGQRAAGVQLQWLTNRLAAAQGPVWWASLKEPLTTDQVSTLQQWLWDVESQGTPYDYVQALGAGIDAGDRLGLENTPDESAFFCSELVVCALQKVGVVSDRLNASEQTPADVMTLPCFNDPVQIQ